MQKNSWNLNNNTPEIYYKVDNGSSVSLSSSNPITNLTKAIGQIDNNTAHTLVLYANDKFSTSNILTLYLSPGVPILTVKSNPKAVGVNKIPEESLDVGGSVRLSQDLIYAKITGNAGDPVTKNEWKTQIIEDSTWGTGLGFYYIGGE